MYGYPDASRKDEETLRGHLTRVTNPLRLPPSRRNRASGDPRSRCKQSSPARVTDSSKDPSKGGVVCKVGKGEYRGFVASIEGVAGIKASTLSCQE